MKVSGFSVSLGVETRPKEVGYHVLLSEYELFAYFVSALLVLCAIIVAVLLCYDFDEKWHPETPRGGVGSDFVSEIEGEW